MSVRYGPAASCSTRPLRLNRSGRSGPATSNASVHRYRYALSGQPVENVPEELFSIMQWVDAGVLGPFDLFDAAFIVRDHFGGVKKYKNLGLLHGRLSAVMARRSWTDPEVAPYLPTVAETTRYVDIDPAGRALYNQIATDLLAELTAAAARGASGYFDLSAHYRGEQVNDNSAKGRIMARYQALAMSCAHPDLLVASAQDWADSRRQQASGVSRRVWPGSRYCHDLWQSGALDDVLTSPKLDDVTALARTVLAEPHHKLIIFSFWKEMLHLLSEKFADYGSVQYHGDLPAAAKTAAQARFSEDPNCRLFIATDAGALRHRPPGRLPSHQLRPALVGW